MRKSILILGINLIFLFTLSLGIDSTNAEKFYNPTQLVRYPWGDAVATPENPFTALAFRQAMSMAFDYGAFLTDVVGETGFRLEGMIPLRMFGHHDTLLEEGILPTYQPDAAKALFDAVGWTGTITFSYPFGSATVPIPYLNLKTSIEAMNVGIAIEVRGVTWPEYFSMIDQGSLPVLMLGWAPDYADPDNYVGSFLHSEDGIYALMIGYANPTLDNLLVQAARETDVAVREQLYFDIEEMAVRDMVWLYLYQERAQNYPRMWLEGLPASGWFNPMNSLQEVLHRVNKTDGTIDTPQNTYITETIGSPAPFDPAYNYEPMGGGMNAMVRDTLMMYKNNDTTLSPALATGYTISPDAKNITFTLRQNVQFTDGSPFNAYVMKYSIDRACLFNDPYGSTFMITPNLLGGEYFFLDNPNMSDAIDFLNAGGVTADDEFTLTIHQAEPYIPMLHALQYQVCSAISAKDAIENVPSDYTTDDTNDSFGQVPLTAWFPDLTEAEIRMYLGLNAAADLGVSALIPGSRAEGETAHDHLNTWIVGTGPYKMLTNDPIHYTYEFEWNTDYWGNKTGEDPFAADAVQYIKIHGEMDEDSVRIQNLLNGKIDITWVPTASLALVRDPDTGVPAAGLNHYEFPTFSTMFAGFNLFDEGPAEFFEFNGSYSTGETINGDQRTETTTITEMITEHSIIVGATKTTTEHYTITVTNDRPIPGFEIVLTLSWLFVFSVIFLLYRRKRVEK